VTAAPLSRDKLATMIDHTLLGPEATGADVEAFCREAVELGVYAVCVSPARVTTAAREVSGTGVVVASVAGFPSGAHHASVKAAEAGRAVSDGASEVDMVIDLGLARSGRWDEVGEEITAVRAAAPRPALLKVIIETAVLEPAEIVAACRAAESAGADYVKTSTGFHPGGGATAGAVGVISGTVRPRLGVKASGGIRSLAGALAMVDAGATRLGLSRSAAVLTELEA
jgi:deoxyribose-phosphate aldolase